jgi:hypothetical protein
LSIVLLLPQPQRFEKPGPAITANADFVRSNFGAGLMLWHQKESAERKVAHRDWPPVSFIRRNPGFSWAIPE